MGAVTIVEITNEHPNFYRWIGPFLGSREVHAELGGPVYDDVGKRWWVAFDTAAHDVLGFCALTVVGPTVHLGSAYVVPAAREAGVYAQLFEARLRAAVEMGMKIRAAVRPDAKKLFVRHAFKVVRETANYTTFEREPKVRTTKEKRR